MPDQLAPGDRAFLDWLGDGIGGLPLDEDDPIYCAFQRGWTAYCTWDGNNTFLMPTNENHPTYPAFWAGWKAAIAHSVSEIQPISSSLAQAQRDLARERNDHATTRRNLATALEEQAATLDELAQERARRAADAAVVQAAVRLVDIIDGTDGDGDKRWRISTSCVALGHVVDAWRAGRKSGEPRPAARVGRTY